MRARLALLLIVATVGAIASVPAAKPSPERSTCTAAYRDVGLFASRIVRLMGANRYDIAWLYLHPAQRETVPLARYVTCELRSPVPPVGAVSVLSVTVGSVSIAGMDYPEPGYSVRLKTKFVVRGLPPGYVRHTVHVVPVDGRYSWILTPTRYAAYADGGCP